MNGVRAQVERAIRSAAIDGSRIPVALETLIESCLAFKLADPHVIPPMRMDRDALRSAAEVTDAGVELDTVVAPFAVEVLPA